MQSPFDIGWITDTLLIRHPLAGQIPLAVLLLLIFVAWRGAGNRLSRGSTAIRVSLALAGVITGLFLVSGVIYARSWFFLDHVEPNVVGISEMFATGRPIYHATDAAPRYALLYGPNLFIIYGTLLKLTGGSIPFLKVAVLVGFALAITISFRAYRAVQLRTFAWLGTAYILVAIASYADLPLWVRAEPALLLLTAIALLAALRCGPIAGAICIGFAAGFAINIKAHAPLYLIAAWMIFPHRWRITSLLTAAVTCIGTASAPFLLFREQASFELYMTWLRAAGKHGLKLSFLARNVEVLSYLTSPVIGLLMIAWFARRNELLAWFRTRLAFVIGLAASIGVVAIVASKPGAGPWHLMPFIIPLGLVLAEIVQLLMNAAERETSTALIPSTPLIVRVLGQSAVGSFVLFSLAITLIRLPYIAGKMRSVDDRAIVAELRQVVATHPDQHVYLGIGADRDWEMSWFRPVLIGLKQPYLLDYAAVMDMKLSGLPMPQATFDAIANDRTSLWLFPRGSKPFTVPTIYNWKTPAFDDDFRAMFEANFHRTDSTPHFDVWTSRNTR